MRPLLALLGLLLALPGSAAPAPERAAAARPFDADRAYRDLVRQCQFGPRVPGTEAHRKCAEWLADQLRASADDLSLQRFSLPVREETLPLTNLVATFNPEGKPHLLLCAHWDSRPTADCDPDPTNRSKPILGANDGASGVAVLLEIARALKARPPRQRVTVVFFDGEDYGPDLDAMFLGSRHFAATYQGPPVAWGVLLDMVGDCDLRLPPEHRSLVELPQVVDRIWGAADRAGCAAFVREPGPSVLDDHVILIERGIPCIDVIDFDYPYWHTAADTPDKCSPASLGQVGRALLLALAEDEAALPPPAPDSLP
jgi:glutaminyl-peptide cyclotransferase